MAGLNLPFYKKEKSNKHSSEIEQFNPAHFPRAV